MMNKFIEILEFASSSCYQLMSVLKVQINLIARYSIDMGINLNVNDPYSVKSEMFMENNTRLQIHFLLALFHRQAAMRAQRNMAVEPSWSEIICD